MPIVTDPHLRRYWNRWRWATWLLSASVLVSLGGLGAGIGWQGKSALMRITDIAIAVVAGAATFLFLRWCAGAVRRFSDRYLMPPAKAAALVDEALAKGLLPSAYRRTPARDRRVAKTIRYDRKIGFTEAEIEKDLEEFAS